MSAKTVPTRTVPWRRLRAMVREPWAGNGFDLDGEMTIRDPETGVRWSERLVRDAEVLLSRLGEPWPFDWFVVDAHASAPLRVRSSSKWGGGRGYAAVVAPRIDAGAPTDLKIVGLKEAVQTANSSHTIAVVDGEFHFQVRDELGAVAAEALQVVLP